MIQLNSQQQNALDTIRQFISGDGQVFILRGYAGTGKTTLMTEVLKILDEAQRVPVLMAPTGRAASVLQTRTGHTASTIHRGIYNFKDLHVKINESDIAKSEFKFYYPILELTDPPFCIVDEASMIGNRFSEGEMWSFGTNHLLDDLLCYANLQHGGKILFVGDPAQLPPVGEPISQALNDTFFATQGLKVASADLTQVMRQDENSTILLNASLARQAYTDDVHNHLCFRQDDTFIPVESNAIADIFYANHPQPEMGESVVICYSNKVATSYNRQIRQRLFGNEDAPLQVGDILMMVANHYDRNTPSEFAPQDIMNGESVRVLQLSNKEEHHVPVYIEGKRQEITIHFLQAKLQLATGNIWSGKIITDPILSDTSGAVSITLIKALYIDFCIRHPQEIKNPKSEEFKKAIQSDPYINALKVRYGYAITGHKSQGGEWDDVFIDFDGIHQDRFGLRWIYTVTTRARHLIYAVNMPSVTPMDKLRIQPITQNAKVHAEWPLPMNTDLEECPFYPDGIEDFKLQQFTHIIRHLRGTDYQVIRIDSMNYRERYTISSPYSQTVLDFMYNGKGVFRPAVVVSGATNEVMDLLNTSLPTEEHFPQLQYEPQTNVAQFLYERLLDACQQTGATVIRIAEHLEHWHILYCLRTDAKATIDFFVDKNGFITYAAPSSPLGKEDAKLQSVIEVLDSNVSPK